jgi:hypothetical protein
VSCTLTEINGSRQKWVCRTAEASEDYKKGVEKPRRDWEYETAGAEDRWKAGIDAAHKKRAFYKAVLKRGQKGWAQKTLVKGPGRWTQGVIDAGDDYEKGFAPYHQLIPSIIMPKRYPRGDPRNLERVKAVCTEEGRLREQIKGWKIF